MRWWTWPELLFGVSAGKAARGFAYCADESSHPFGGLVAAEAPVAAEQLPGVDVGGHDEEVDECVARSVVPRIERGGEDRFDPDSMQALALARHACGERLPALLAEQQQHPVAVRLVVVDEGLDRAVHVVGV